MEKPAVTSGFWKPTPLIVIAGAALLLIAGILLGLVSERNYRAQKVSELGVQAQILGTTVMAALIFDDAAAAQDSVDALRANPEIEVAVVYDENGALFAGFALDDFSMPSSLNDAGQETIAEDRIVTIHAIEQAGQRVGSVYILSAGDPLYRALTRYIGLMLLVTMAMLVLGVVGFSQFSLARANAQLARHASELAETNTRLQTEMSERAKAEEALRQSQKMEAIGQLSGGIAHDFNNLLMIISGNLQLVKKRLNDGRSDFGRYIDLAWEGVERASKLTQRILAFSRRQPLSPTPCDMSKMVRDMMSLLQHSVREKIEIETKFESRWMSHCDVNQMESAILNLAINARDAMPDGGRLIISTADVALLGPSARYPDAVPGEYVEILVRDTGTGMSDEVRQKAIDPFFTTKPQGHGTGLGLSMIFGYAKQSGGYMGIESAEGKGTMVGILLPRHMMDTPDQEEAAPSVPSVAPAGRDKATLLIVEDEMLVRALAVETFEAEGFHVLEAGDGREALDLLLSDTPIDLLLTDVKLPHFNGYQIAQKAAAHRPGLKVVFMTGYANDPMSPEMREAGMRMILKPYQLSELVRLVEDTLHSVPSRAAV